MTLYLSRSRRHSRAMQNRVGIEERWIVDWCIWCNFSSKGSGMLSRPTDHGHCNVDALCKLEVANLQWEPWYSSCIVLSLYVGDGLFDSWYCPYSCWALGHNFDLFAAISNFWPWFWTICDCYFDWNLCSQFNNTRKLGARRCHAYLRWSVYFDHFGSLRYNSWCGNDRFKQWKWYLASKRQR